MFLTTKDVDRALRQEVFPHLKGIGFNRRKGLKLWRDNINSVDVIVFSHLSKYLAESVGTETLSLSIEVGRFLTNDVERELRCERETIMPDPSDCHFRGNLLKTIQQDHLERRDIWHIGPSDIGLTEVMGDILKVIQASVPIWFDRVNDLHNLADFLQSNETEWEEGVMIFGGFGRPKSPVRLRILDLIHDLLSRAR